jgi:predicted small lipoprotein YifL
MQNNSTRILLQFAVLAAVLMIAACGTRTETEKTTIIERKVEVPVYIPDEQKPGHLERAGEKIDQKVGEKIDDAIDSMFRD